MDTWVGLSLLFRQILGEKLRLHEVQKITGLISEPVGVKLLIVAQADVTFLNYLELRPLLATDDLPNQTE